MKTISINNRANLLKVLGVVGALTALYFYRRRGGSVTSLISQGKDLAGKVRDQATEAYNGLVNADSDAEETTTRAKSTARDAVHQAKSKIQNETSSVH